MTVKYTKQEQVAIQLAKDVVVGATIQAIQYECLPRQS